MNLERFFKEHGRTALGFSGGVDSSYLLYFGSAVGADIAPYFIKTPFQPRFELEDARRAADFAGARLRVVELDVLSCREVARNEADRCYHCKRAIFSKVAEVADSEGYEVIIDGTNASDDADDRPGMRAVTELGVLSPLALAGLTKEDVRRLSKDVGLFTHAKPSYSCLATRIRSGEEITGEKLSVVESAESFLASLGLSDFRVRYAGGNARIQLRKEEMTRFMGMREEVEAYFNGLGLAEICLDLRPRQ